MNDYMSDSTNECNYYVYVYLDPRKPGKYVYGDYCFLYEPFYVGKGTGYRFLELKRGRNKHFKNKIKKINKCKLSPIVIKIKENIINEESINLEIRLINLIGRKDLSKGSLINFTDGGEGTSGYKYSKETRELIAKKCRIDFSEIEESFKQAEYTLITTKEEYKNNLTRLEYICDRGHRRFVIWSNFKRSLKCRDCYNEDQRKDFSEIEESFKQAEYTLITTKEEYKNSGVKLKCICPEGHKCKISWNSFRDGVRCFKCYHKLRAEKCKKDFSEIEESFKQVEYTLISTKEDYKNAFTKLEYMCDRGHINSINWAMFQQGTRCSKCLPDRMSRKYRKDFSEIEESFKQAEYTLITTKEEYINSKQKLKCICPEGHTYLTSWNNFQSGRRCPCNRTKKRGEIKCHYKDLPT